MANRRLTGGAVAETRRRDGLQLPSLRTAIRSPWASGVAVRIVWRTLLALVGFALLIGGWHLMAASGRFSPLLLPSPSDVYDTARQLFSNGSLTTDVLASLKRVSIGYALGVAAGVSLGVLFGAVKLLSAIFRPVLEVLRPIPGIAWIPLAIVWFGIGNASSYFIVAIACFFPIFVNTHSAVTSVEGRYLEVARCLGATRRMQALEVTVPAALPRILTGLRVGLGVAWMTVIAAELVAARSGLGYMIQLNRELLQTPAVIVGMALIGLIGFAMSAALEVLERWLVPWERR